MDNHLAKEEITEENLKKKIKENPTQIENYILLSELYQENNKKLQQILEPIQYVEKTVLKTKYDEDICFRKVDIYESFGDIALEAEKDKEAIQYYLVAWKFAKNYMRKVKIKNIKDYDKATISKYSLYDLIYNIDFAYDELGERYARKRRNFIQEIMRSLDLTAEEKKPFLQGLEETEGILIKQRKQRKYKKKNHYFIRKIPIK